MNFFDEVIFDVNFLDQDIKCFKSDFVRLTIIFLVIVITIYVLKVLIYELLS